MPAPARLESIQDEKPVEWGCLVTGENLREHDLVLLDLLDEMGRGLARQERLLEEIEGWHVQARTFRIQAGAEEPTGWPDGDDLADELRLDLELRLEQEAELDRILEVLRHRSALQDRVLDELSPRLAPEHRDGLLQELEDHVERRDLLFEDIESRPFEEKRDRISGVMPLLGELEGRLFRVVERHLVGRHRAGE
jgi:uncharacterized coiled-coil protein SlyX